ncbi:LVIVD repeat-containing protein [Flavobacterium capsici]|uniref:LVIVD repeat-containing protein n=1 Tax=Flavobacterium capsici TaxID=3075618 RepID=A0AA96EYV7_9FLAO|nr:MULTISPECIES: hypothetical protein [unclassified Flavobacterium]WNM19510.1 hypothetical protein RN608_02230 [Flavobacterium sp. PMR2A8]WNM20899.1 hypothetical protein RN605_09400 [Flavobacterium sp. PMTSA4]
MKTIKLLLITCCVALFFSCSNDDKSNGEAIFAVPILKTKAAIRSGISVVAARQTNSDGKIYVTENDLFYIAQEDGVHIFDNTNPASPTNTVFLNIEGVHDIAVKGNYLYADNYMDLLVFDISDLNNITLVRTVENVVEFYAAFPEEAEFYDYTIYPNEDEIVVGYQLETRERPSGQELIFANDATTGVFESASGGSVGTGGSYARFQINNNALYTVDSYKLNVFNITNPLTTFFDKSIYMETWFGGQLETLFKQKQYLFVGATTGMHIVDAEDEFNPFYVSSFSHATACDPVVVWENTAYITIRSGNTCGAIDDQINVIDLNNIQNPSLVSTYLTSQPKGLGVKQNALYVCTADGLKVFDATNSSSLTLQNTYQENVSDVIALDSHLIAVGPNRIVQYNYGANFTLQPINVLTF